MIIKLAFYFLGLLGSLVLLVGVYGAYKGGLKENRQVDRGEFWKDLTIFLKVAALIVSVSFTLSFISARFYYTGKCRLEFVYYTTAETDCSFWQFFAHIWLEGIYGNR